MLRYIKYVYLFYKVVQCNRSELVYRILIMLLVVADEDEGLCDSFMAHFTSVLAHNGMHCHLVVIPMCSLHLLLV